MELVLSRAISWFFRVLIYLLLGRAILSWFVAGSSGSYGNPALIRIYEICTELTEPFVAPCRKLLQRFNTGVFDFSVLLAFFLIQITERIVLIIVYKVLF